jgi:hypothetical protein
MCQKQKTSCELYRPVARWMGVLRQDDPEDFPSVWPNCQSAPVRCSELELEGELDGAGATDLVEGVETTIGVAGAQEARQHLRRMVKEGAGQAVVGVPEVGVIEDIEELGTEAQAQLLRQRKAPLKGHIRLRGSESTQDVAAEIALGSGRRRDERGLVEDFAPWILRAEQFERKLRERGLAGDRARCRPQRIGRREY